MSVTLRGSNNNVHIEQPRSRKSKKLVDTASKVPSLPAVSTTPSLPVKVTTTPPAEAPNVAVQATQDKVKLYVTCFITIIGIILLVAGTIALTAHALGGVPIDPNAIQTIYMCGLGTTVGGLSLQNTDYKGSLSVGGGALPFNFNLQPIQK